jgi:hypothetical protein
MRALACLIALAAACGGLGPAAGDARDRGSLLRAQNVPMPAPQPKRSRPELKTLSDFGHAIHACWKSPSRAEAPQDIMITVKLSFTRSGEVFGKPLVTYITPGTAPEHEAAYRRAVAQAFLRCMPLNLSKGLGNAIAGRPFSFSFGNERGRHNAGGAPAPDVAYRRPI